LPDFTGSNTQPVANSRTNSKGIPFQKAFYFIHIANLENIGKTAKPAVRKQSTFLKFAALTGLRLYFGQN